MLDNLISTIVSVLEKLGVFIQLSLLLWFYGLLLNDPLVYAFGAYGIVLFSLTRVLWYVIDSNLGIGTRSWLFSLVTTRLPHSELRSDFRTRLMNIRPPPDGNQHAQMAACRSTADDFITSFATGNGLPLYSVSSSPKDEWKGIAGSRFYYFEKDLRMQYRNDAKPDNHCLKLIDVDYYIDSKTLLDHVDEARCACFYTIMPDVLAVTTEESTFCMDKDGFVTESHASSTPYTHYLWNWRVDYITSTSMTFRGLWPSFSFRHYYVEARKVGLNRYVVCLVPSVTGGLLAHLAWRYLNPDRQEFVRSLETWRPQHINGVNVLVTPTKVMVAYPNATRQFELTHDQFGELRHAPKLSGAGAQRIINSTATQYELASIGNSLNAFEVSMNPQAYDYKEPRSYKVEYSDLEDPVVKPRGRHTFPPLVDGAFSPVSSESNDRACINGRLVELQAKRRPVSPKYYDYMKEFIAQFDWVPPQSLHPVTVDDVIERATSSQKKKYHSALLELPTKFVHKAFQKTEAYPDPKDPRNISAVDPKHVLRLSCFIQVAVDYLKKYVPWYAFGLAPSDMADAVLDLMSGEAGELVEGDFSRYDGTQGSIDVDLNTGVLLHLFAEEYHDEIRALKYELSYCMFSTEHKIRYCTNDTMKSGSADTSKSNTVSHGFCQFSHFRNLHFNPRESWLKIGLCGGDDGLMRTPSPSNYEQTCADLGKKLKCNIRSPGEPVGFLGRVWSDWTSNESFFDPYRCISKLHFTDNSDKNARSEVLAWRKAVGYYVTDNGNFVGHIADKILDITAAGKTEVVERREWLKCVLAENTEYTTDQIREKFKDWSVFPTTSSHPRTLRLKDGSEDPCFTHFLQQMAEHGVQAQAVYDWYLQLMDCDRLEDFPTLHRVEVAAPTIAMTVDGMTLGPEMAPKPTIPTTEAPICYYMFNRRKCTRGDKCKYSHDTSTCCHDFIKDKCSRKVCRKKHIPLSAAL